MAELTEQVSFRVKPETAKKIKKIEVATGFKKSDLLRVMLDSGIDELFGDVK